MFGCDPWSQTCRFGCIWLYLYFALGWHETCVVSVWKCFWKLCSLWHTAWHWLLTTPLRQVSSWHFSFASFEIQRRVGDHLGPHALNPAQIPEFAALHHWKSWRCTFVCIKCVAARPARSTKQCRGRAMTEKKKLRHPEAKWRFSWSVGTIAGVRKTKSNGDGLCVLHIVFSELCSHYIT